MDVPVRERELREWDDAELHGEMTYVGLLLEDDNDRIENPDRDLPALSPFHRKILNQRLDAICREIERRVIALTAA